MGVEDRMVWVGAYRAGVKDGARAWLEDNRRDVLAAIREAFRPEAGAAPGAPADRRAAAPAELHRELAEALMQARAIRDGGRSGLAADLVDRLERIAAMIAMPGDDDAGGAE